MNKRKVMVIGLDCATPELVFDRFRGDLPNLSSLMERGAYARMHSSIPPITIPAWYSMMSGKEPGTLGLYGFKHRRGRAYDETWIADSRALPGTAVWDIVGELGGKVCLVSVPPSYPPREVNGVMVGCFLTPDTASGYTYPPELRDEIEEVVGEYLPDVEFRTGQKDTLLEELYMMTEKRFDLVLHLIESREWDFFMFVEIGLDRIQHAYWRYFDPEHHLFEEGSPFQSAILDYYRFLDEQVGRVLDKLDDDTIVLVVSDHGAKRMKGAFCINEWLIEKGLLALKGPVQGVKSIDDLDIDWPRTKAWGWGGYYARVFLNVEGREEDGTIPSEEYESFRDELAERIKAIPDNEGRPMKTTVYKPEDIYRDPKGDYPDLMVFFDDLYWRSAGTVGHPTGYLLENDTGPDDAVHDWYGIFIAYDPKREIGRRMKDLKIHDVAPTILELMGVEIPDDMDGCALDIYGAQGGD